MMRNSPKSLAFLACASLLALQLSGVHMHVDDHGYVGVAEGIRSHSHATHQHDDGHHSDGSGGHVDGHANDHDFEGAKDVSIVDLVSGASKLSLDLIVLAFLLPVLLWQAGQAVPIFAARIFSGRHTRWRPPLRAPPRFS